MEVVKDSAASGDDVWISPQVTRYPQRIFSQIAVSPAQRQVLEEEEGCCGV